MTTTTTHPTDLDQEKLEAFIGRLVNDIGTAYHGAVSWIGDRLGLFKAMAGAGPVSSVSLAEKTGLAERYVREWLAAMAAAEYVAYDPATTLYELPPEHALPLADETFNLFVGGFVEFIVPWATNAPKVADAFRRGGGVAQGDYLPETFEAIERASAPWYANRLVREWLPTMPQAVAALESGGTALDVGCGSGRAAITLARAFPAARVLGYDIHPGSIARARANAAASGVADRVAFEVVDCTDIPEGQFDLITVFDVIHDSVDPVGLLRAMRDGLAPGGACLVQEMNAAPTVEANINPLGKLLYSASVLYCMTVSLADDGAGIGTAMGEPRFRKLVTEAGFGTCGRLPIDDPFVVLYELRS